MKLIIAEKPSVARDIAQALGIPSRGRHFFQSDAYCITWALGHLVTLAEPHEIDPAWRAWRLADLPLLPPRWPLVVVEKTAEQFAEIRTLMHRTEIKSLVAATDAGREGELIFRYIYEKAGCTKPVERLWLSSLTSESIRQGFERLRPWSEFDRLADNARGRSRADWLVGLNFSRAYSLSYRQKWTVGRVQTPTLAMVVERTEAIQNFVPEPYAEIEVEFQTPEPSLYKGHCAREISKGRWEVRRFQRDDPELEIVKTRAERGQARIWKREDKEQRIPAPKLFDLTELQKEANRIYGLHAKASLDIAQSLYEKHKLITYPRTDSRYLSATIAQELPRIVAAIRAPYEHLGLHARTGQAPLGRAYVDDSRVGDHHALIPTGRNPQSCRLTEPEQNIFDLIARRLLMAWQDDHIRSQCLLLTAIHDPDVESASPGDIYLARGSTTLEEGWKRLDRRSQREGGDLPRLPVDTPVSVRAAQVLHKETRPPQPLTDASLLNAMASAGSRLDDKELTDILRERGLGTPATRAAIIENLLQRSYIERRDKTLWATALGIDLIHHVHPTVRSAALTGEWEAKLQAIEAGHVTLDSFMQEIIRYVSDTVQLIRSQQPPQTPSTRAHSESIPPVQLSPARRAPPEPTAPQASARSPASRAGSSLPSPVREAIGAVRAGATRYNDHEPDAALQTLQAALGEQSQELLRSRSPRSSLASGEHSSGRHDARPVGQQGTALGNDPLRETLLQVFGHSGFRPHQEAICRDIIGGHDLLLVMPTGAGKSLCYQLPALLRPGCAIVISPLIALMDDQVSKLRSLQVPAAALHSGLSREESRATFRDYLNGRLKLLYIAPERLGLSGFLDLLAQHPPSLVAVDEAHCISQWGHDFRPDYRMLADRLPRLRPAPIVAMTATATPEVQTDIRVQLGLEKPMLHIHGFRRKNIAIEISEVPLPDRPELIRQILRQKTHLPAIIYAPTRKETESLATLLAGSLQVAPYHAGLSAEKRAHIQSEFQRGQLEVIVATIAFGMGIDKGDIRTVIHTAIPSSIEAYYQEIGRAGRDGKLSRAILLHSYADRRTREFFIHKNYPDIAVLERILQKIPLTGIEHSALSFGKDADSIDQALEKLWIHGAIEMRADDRVLRREAPQWKQAYLAQQTHKQRELELIAAFAENQYECRMLQFLEHFGDQSDGRGPCGICDVCLPQGSLTKDTRPPTDTERLAMLRICSALASSTRPLSMSRLLQQMQEETRMDRGHLEACVQALIRSGLICSQRESFVKGSTTVSYRSLSLVQAPSPGWDGSSVNLVTPTASAWASSAGKQSSSRQKKRKSQAPNTPKAPRQGATAYDPDDALTQKLRSWRLRMARSEKVPAYRVFSDRTLAALVATRPQDEATLKHVDGIGPVTYEKYGRDLLSLLRGP